MLIPDLERDLVEAAERLSTPHEQTRRAARLALGAVVVVAAVAAALSGLLGSDDQLVTGDNRARDAPARGGPDDPALHPPPPPNLRPVPNSLSTLLTVRFDGVRYEITGFRSRDGSICMRAVVANRRLGGVTCSGERNLRRGLRASRVLNVGGGGGEHLFEAGFTRPDAGPLRVVGTDWPSRVVVSPRWRPDPWRGAPIRAFYAVIDPPAGTRVTYSEHTRIRVVER